MRQFKGEKAVRKHLETLKNFEARRDWLVHVYMDEDMLNEILDEAGYMNHSTKPNLGSGEDPHSSYATRNIKKGEEFFEDYDSFGWPKWLIKLNTEYGIDLSYFKPGSQDI